LFRSARSPLARRRCRPTAPRSGCCSPTAARSTCCSPKRSAADARLARLADTTPVVGQESIDAAADRLLFDAATVVTRAARGERLIATHLALGLLERCLEAAMVRRDLGTGSCVHRHATAYDDLADLLPALPAAPGPEDLLDLAAAALDCFEQITGTPLRRAAVDALIGKARRALG
jgi:hypothetical protein